MFWTAHDPTRQIQSRQYKRAVFYHDAAQRELAIRSRDQLEKALRRPTVTEILPATRFYLAEAYHQKYHLRQSHELLAELTAIYPISTDLLNSTAAARVNGLLGGHDDGRIDRTGLGLSARAQSLLG